MLGTVGDPLEDKPRKPFFFRKIGSRISDFLIRKQNSKKKSKVEIEKECMNLHWNNFDYELDGNTKFEMPPRMVVRRFFFRRY